MSEFSPLVDLEGLNLAVVPVFTITGSFISSNEHHAVKVGTTDRKKHDDDNNLRRSGILIFGAITTGNIWRNVQETRLQQSGNQLDLVRHDGV